MRPVSRAELLVELQQGSFDLFISSIFCNCVFFCGIAAAVDATGAAQYDSSIFYCSQSSISMLLRLPLCTSCCGVLLNGVMVLVLLGRRDPPFEQDHNTGRGPRHWKVYLLMTTVMC